MLTDTRPCPRFDLPAPDVADATAIAALLADRTRAGILALLRDGPHCVCELAATFGERENNVSNHLAKLRDAGLVRASRHDGDARWMYYERDEAAVAAALAALRDDPRMTTLALRHARVPFWATVATGIVAWLIAWILLAPAVDWLTTDVMGLDTTEGFGASLAFFLFDLPKVMLLLVGVVTAVSLLRSFVSPERVRRTLAGRNVVVGATAAAGFGIITPFCSCSAVPLFIGFVEAGVPLGVTFAFLIASPMVNEVALVLLWGLFGPAIAIAYLIAGLMVAIGAGLVIGRLQLERYVEPYVYQVHSGAAIEMRLTMEQRVRDAWGSTRQLVRRIAPWVVIGIALGSLIHGYAPMDLVAQIGGRSNPLAVPLVIMLGVPLYANAAGTIPIVEALLGKGLPIGTVLAFMMAVTALSLPELLILRRVMRRQLIAAFVAIVAGGILVVGYLFNAFAS